MEEPSRLYRMVEKRLAGTLADFVAARRASNSWTAIAAEITKTTDILVSDETLRRWFADRITVEVRVDAPGETPASAA